LLSSLAKETMAAIPTRYGDVTVTRDNPECGRQAPGLAIGLENIRLS